jgi:molybdopterin-guanine dinucleotide biosynthesis protein A
MNLKQKADNNITAFILAGGKGKRLTHKKSLIQINKKPLILQTVIDLLSIFSNVILLSDSRELYSFLDIPIYKDIIKNIGPLGGIYTGLNISETDWNFFIACDMPFINLDIIKILMENISDKYDCIIPFVKGYYEPLFAFYNKRATEYISNSIGQNEYKIQSFFKNINIKKIHENEFEGIDNIDNTFVNINTKNDIENFRKLIKN